MVLIEMNTQIIGVARKNEHHFIVVKREDLPLSLFKGVSVDFGVGLWMWIQWSTHTRHG